MLSLVWEDRLEKEMATQSSILAWEIQRTEEPGRLQLIELQRALEVDALEYEKSGERRRKKRKREERR